MDTKSFKRTLQQSDNYNRKGFGHKEEVMDAMTNEYQSDLIQKIRENNYRLQRGDVTIYLAQAFGFCWGVERAVAMAYETRQHFPQERLWITNEIIHNPSVNQRLRSMAVGFIPVENGQKDFSVVESGDVVILPAFGASVSEREWQVVGLVGSDAQGPKLYMNQEVFGYENRIPARANSVQVITESHDLLGQKTMESLLLQHFEKLGYAVRTTRTTQTLNAQNGLMFDVIVGFLILNAVLLGLVGSLGLSTTMGINMLERIREIGVLRAVGASNGAIRRIVLLEGLVIATLSWLIGLALSYPVAQVMSEQIGVALLDTPLSFTYALPAAIAWFFVLLVLAVAASLGPARNAVRLTIREVLAYE